MSKEKRMNHAQSVILCIVLSPFLSISLSLFFSPYFTEREKRKDYCWFIKIYLDILYSLILSRTRFLSFIWGLFDEKYLFLLMFILKYLLKNKLNKILNIMSSEYKEIRGQSYFSGNFISVVSCNLKVA